MIEFIVNIGKGLWENREAILLFLGSSQFLAFLTAIFTLVRYNRSTKDNTKQNKELKESLENQGKLTEVSGNTYDKTVTIETDLVQLKETTDKNDEKTQADLTLLIEKMNLLLEALGIVYSGIKDEKIRTTVNGLLLNAKYSENSARAELQKQIEELREQVAKKSEELNEMVNSTAKKAVAALTGEAPKEEVVERY